MKSYIIINRLLVTALVVSLGDNLRFLAPVLLGRYNPIVVSVAGSPEDEDCLNSGLGKHLEESMRYPDNLFPKPRFGLRSQTNSGEKVGIGLHGAPHQTAVVFSLNTEIVAFLWIDTKEEIVFMQAVDDVALESILGEIIYTDYCFSADHHNDGIVRGLMVKQRA